MKKHVLINWLHSQSIRNKVLVFGIVMSTIPLLIISYFYYIQVKLELEKRIIEKQELITGNLSNEIELEFNQVIQQIQMIASLHLIQPGNASFYELLQQNNFIEEVVLTNQRGLVEKRVSRYHLNIADEKEKWYTDDMWYAFQTEEVIFGEVEFNTFGQPIMKLAVPMQVEGERKGIGVVIQLQKIIGLISSLRQEYSSYLYLIDHNNRVIAHQDYSKLWEKETPTNEKNDNILSVQTKIDDLDWTLVMEQPRTIAYNPINKMFQAGLMVVAVGTLLISLISIYAGLYFTKPIVLLDQAMKKLQLGYNIDPIQLKRKDELGKLIVSFNKMSEQLLEKSLRLEMEKERLNIVVNGIGAGLALVTSNFKISWMNPILKDWLQKENIELPCYKCIGGQDYPCTDCPITDQSENHFNGNKILKNYKVKGEDRIFQHRVFPLNHTMEGEGEFLLVIEDITEQKNMEEKIIQTDKLSALGVMASSFAHEVNNPLTTINVYAEDLQDRLQMKDQSLDEDEIHYYLNKIVENTKRCKKITSNLLNFSRKSNWSVSSIDINETIQNSITLVEHALKKKNIQLSIHVDPNLPIIVGDGLKLMQVFVNLIQNSMDAMETGGSLEITAQKDQNWLLFIVKDNGCGIPKEILSKVFDPFYTTKPIGKGTGLGLSVCYGIIQQFGGSMEMESQVGKGTSAIIRIPIKEENKKNGNS